MKPIKPVIGAAAILLAMNAFAQDAKPVPATPIPAAALPAAGTAPAAKPRTVALISAVGDQFTYLRQRQAVGSNMEPFVRRVVKVANGELDGIVLRGLDKSYSQQDPDAKKIFMRINPGEMENVYPQDREKVAIGKIVSHLQRVDRTGWDVIIAVTPAYQFSATGGMGSKLEGIGVYIQPLENTATTDFDSEVGGMEEATTSNPNDRTKKSKSTTYVAPYSYTQLWVIDPVSLNVITKETSKQHIKLYDPDSTALDVSKQMSVDQLAGHIEGFVERSSAKALKDAIGTVTVEEKAPPTKK